MVIKVMRMSRIGRPFVLLQLLLLFTFCISIFTQAQELQCSPSNPEYDWERWNYYDMLGLKRGGEELESKQVRKAYRKQAQLWHPDKHKHNNNSTTTSGSTSGSASAFTSTREYTARFTRIAEAYEVMNNVDKRREYDLFLRYCDEIEQTTTAVDKASRRASYRKQWSSLVNKVADPLRVFEEFIFGKYDEDDDDFEYDPYFDFVQARNRQNQKHRRRREEEKPIKVTKHQDALQDPYTGEEIVRISQTEEYPVDPSTGDFYYRILSQEFTKRFDPYTGISLQPSTQPYLREEGYRNIVEEQQKKEQQQSESQEQSPRQSLLFPGDVLTPTSALLVSPNKRYYAGLSPECELLIMKENAYRDDDLIWSSQTIGKNCFATLRGPHLVVAMGRPEHPHRILWYSEAAEDDEDDHGIFQTTHHSSTYMAQLDNSGSLVVYKVWDRPKMNTSNGQDPSLAIRAWVATRNFLLGNTKVEYDMNYNYASTGITYKRCIYATGKLGCYRFVRRFYQLSIDIYYALKNIVARVDHAFDTWMDLILEEDDYVHALKETIFSGGNQLATSSARLVRKVLEIVLTRSKA